LHKVDISTGFIWSFFGNLFYFKKNGNGQKKDETGGNNQPGLSEFGFSQGSLSCSYHLNHDFLSLFNFLFDLRKREAVS